MAIILDGSTRITSPALDLTTPLPVADGGTGATSNAATSYALKGANSDITSISGLNSLIVGNKETMKPVFGSKAPKITFFIRDWMITPAHIRHGSKVEINVNSSSRAVSNFFAADLIANNSAWAEGSFNSTFLFISRAIISF